MPMLVGSNFNPSRGGHAPGDLRDAFLAGTDALQSWNAGDPEPCVELRDQVVPVSTVAGLLWSCTDILPGRVLSELQDMGLEPRRQTYAAAAREVKRWLSQAQATATSNS